VIGLRRLLGAETLAYNEQTLIAESEVSNEETPKELLKRDESFAHELFALQCKNFSTASSPLTISRST